MGFEAKLILEVDNSLSKEIHKEIEKLWQDNCLGNDSCYYKFDVVDQEDQQ